MLERLHKTRLAAMRDVQSRLLTCTYLFSLQPRRSRDSSFSKTNLSDFHDTSSPTTERASAFWMPVIMVYGSISRALIPHGFLECILQFHRQCLGKMFGGWKQLNVIC